MSVKNILEQHDQEQAERAAQRAEGQTEFKPFGFFVRPGQTARVMFISEEFKPTTGRSVWGLIDGQKFVKDHDSFTILDEMERLEKVVDEKYMPKHRLVKLGVATVIDIGQLEIDNRGKESIVGYKSAKDSSVVYLGMKRLMIGKLGTVEHPSAIRKLLNTAARKVAARDNGLAFTVWDISRSGAKTDANGDSFEFVTSFTSGTEALEYLKSFGVKPENVKLTEYPAEEAVTMLEQVDTDLVCMKAQRRIEEIDALNSAELDNSEAKPKAKAKGKR